MMMLSEAAKALNTVHIGKDVEVSCVGTDSRYITPGQLFVAIRGEHFDGNLYVQDAFEKGAVAAIVSDETITAPSLVSVADTRLALGDLARYWRKKFAYPVVAVTGSNGKTTLKEMIAAVMTAAGANVLATKGNLNNDIGMPLTLLGMRAVHSCAVIEMGMNHQGEIRYLSNIACPQVAVINNAGTAHIGELGSRQAIAQAKGEVFEGLGEHGIAVINMNDAFAGYWQSLNTDRKMVTFGMGIDADVSANYSVQSGKTMHMLTTPAGTMPLKLSVLGDHNVMNALAAAAVAVALGVSNDAIVKGLQGFSGVQGRLNLLSGYNNAMVIDDTYNANPDSMKAAIDVLATQFGSSNNSLIMVMGDMAELGDAAESLHADIGQYAKVKGIAKLFSFGALSQRASQTFGKDGQHFESIDLLILATKAQMHAGAIVLVKGSRIMKMERVVDAIKNDLISGGAQSCY